MVDEVVKNMKLERKTHKRICNFYKANFAILVAIFIFNSVRQKIGASSHCKVLWHIPSQERGHHKSDPGNGKVQRKP